MRWAALVSALLLLAAAPHAADTLECYFIDVEGGQSTLIVTPAGESLLIDAGYAAREGRRDADRIVAAARFAGLDHIDYLLVTHFHPDHVGGVPELAAQLPIGTFIDYGEPLGTDRMTGRGFAAYAPLRAQGRHLRPRPGDRLPLTGVEVTVVSSDGQVLPSALPGGGQPNETACATVEDQPDDGTENYRSVGVLVRFGAFSLLDVGDLSGNTLATLACPRNLLGHVEAYVVPHHGDYDTNIPALVSALRPRVAIMNNGVHRGGAPEAFRTLHGQPGLEDLWQLHLSHNPGAENSTDALVANVDDGASAFWLSLSADAGGGFRVTNNRNGFSRRYN